MKTNIKLSTTFFNKLTVILQANDNLIFFLSGWNSVNETRTKCRQYGNIYLGIYIVYTVN